MKRFILGSMLNILLVGSQVLASGQVVANFNSLTVNQAPPSGYPIAGFSWQGFWVTAAYDVPQFSTQSISTTSASALTGSVTIPSGYTLTSFQAGNGASSTQSVKVSCTGNPTFTVNVASGQAQATITTNWVNLCSVAQFTMSGGWNTDLDNFVFSAISSPTPTPTPTPTPSRVTVIKATASDSVGVTKVEFYVNGALTCTIPAAPYNCSWTVPVGAGIAYQLQTKAYDAQGKVGSSQIVTVTSD